MDIKNNKFVNLDNIKTVWRNIHERFQRIYAVTSFDLSGVLQEFADTGGVVTELSNETSYYMNDESYEQLIEYLTTGFFDKTITFKTREFCVLGKFIYKESYPGSTSIPMADVVLIDDLKNIYNFKIVSELPDNPYRIKVKLEKAFYSKDDTDNIEYKASGSYGGDWTLDRRAIDNGIPPGGIGKKLASEVPYTIGEYKYYGQTSVGSFVINKPTTYYLIDSYNQYIDIYIIKLKNYFSDDMLINRGFRELDLIKVDKIPYDTLVKNKVDVTTLPPKTNSAGEPIEGQYLLDGLTIKSTDNIYKFTINPEFIFEINTSSKNRRAQYVLSIFRRSANGNGVKNQYVKLAERPS